VVSGNNEGGVQFLLTWQFYSAICNWTLVICTFTLQFASNHFLVVGKSCCSLLVVILVFHMQLFSSHLGGYFLNTHFVIDGKLLVTIPQY